MKTISFTEARDNLNNVLDQVVNGAEPIVINGSGEGDVVVMNNSAHLERSIAQYSEGKSNPGR